MFGIYARNVIDGRGDYIPNDDEDDYKPQVVISPKEGGKMLRCRCKPGECNANKKCHYTNQLYYSTEKRKYLTLEEYLKLK